MKNYILKPVFSLIIILGFVMNANAQKSEDCKAPEPLLEKMCYEKVVSNLGDFIEYPEDAYFNEDEGQVVVRFSTDENRKIKNIVVVEADNKNLAKEVLKAVQLMALESDTNYMAANKVYRVPVDFRITE